MSPLKKLGKDMICKLLEAQVERLRRDNKLTIIAVAGSVGKTSTKLAIAKLLSSKQKVCYQEGNYNDRLTVPLVFFGQAEPNIFNIGAWIKILLANERKLRSPYPYQAVVLELGVDGPGQMEDFAYLKPDLVVVTAVAPEHMEYFKTIHAVAHEELLTTTFSKQALLNTDDIAPHYLPGGEYFSYGFSEGATYKIAANNQTGLSGQDMTLALPGGQNLAIHSPYLGTQGAKIIAAAAAVAHLARFTQDEIQTGLQQVNPVPGRMQILAGKDNSQLIDDTYNASPLAVKAALDVLYAVEAPQRIAILGSMNELGADSAAAHQEVGNYCDPGKLELVVTIGKEAEEYLASAAAERGCQVKSFSSPYEAGVFVNEHLKPGAVVLAKGSQNGVFAEESLKILLANLADEAKLVRQSAYWLQQKASQFKQPIAVPASQDDQPIEP